MDVAFRTVAASADQDRVAHHAAGEMDVFVLADGAGGVAGGREAAEFAVANVSVDLFTAEACSAGLRRLDLAIERAPECGETTAVLLVVSAGMIFGASVGDSGIWTCHREASFDLTAGQHRKPLLGSGSAKPVSFGPHLFSDRLLIASDGLLKYVPAERIRSLSLLNPLSRAIDELVAAARLPSGKLQDDVAVALIEP